MTSTDGRTEDTAETWAFCSDCRRWFYCPTWFDRDAAQPVCPVCWSEPVAIERVPQREA